MFGDGPLSFKKLIYEMRFDEASARFAEFSSFHVGNLVDEARLLKLLQVDR